MFQKIHPWGCTLGPKFPPHVGRPAKKIWQQFRPYMKKSMPRLFLQQNNSSTLWEIIYMDSINLEGVWWIRISIESLLHKVRRGIQRTTKSPKSDLATTMLDWTPNLCSYVLVPWVWLSISCSGPLYSKLGLSTLSLEFHLIPCPQLQLERKISHPCYRSL